MPDYTQCYELRIDAILQETCKKITQEQVSNPHNYYISDWGRRCVRSSSSNRCLLRLCCCICIMRVLCVMSKEETEA